MHLQSQPHRWLTWLECAPIDGAVQAPGRPNPPYVGEAVPILPQSPSAKCAEALLVRATAHCLGGNWGLLGFSASVDHNFHASNFFISASGGQTLFHFKHRLSIMNYFFKHQTQVTSSKPVTA